MSLWGHLVIVGTENPEVLSGISSPSVKLSVSSTQDVLQLQTNLSQWKSEFSRVKSGNVEKPKKESWFFRRMSAKNQEVATKSLIAH